MGGIPPGMTERTFLAAEGVMTATALDEKGTRLEFEFSGLIPNGVYTLWNVLTPLPDFSDDPLGEEGFGDHGLITDRQGRAEAVVFLNERPGEIFLLDYHADGELTGEKGEVVFPGVLWARSPSARAEEPAEGTSERRRRALRAAAPVENRHVTTVGAVDQSSRAAGKMETPETSAPGRRCSRNRVGSTPKACLKAREK